MTWQPIENYDPERDGANVDVWQVRGEWSGRVADAYLNDRDQWCAQVFAVMGDGIIPGEITHFMPLPAPPSDPPETGQ